MKHFYIIWPNYHYQSSEFVENLDIENRMPIWLYGSCGSDLGQSIAEVTDNIHAIGMVKPVYERSIFPLTATAV